VARGQDHRAHADRVQAVALPAVERSARAHARQILEKVWDYTFAGNASVLETYVSYLRHKIDVVDPPLIHTVRGVGYTLRLPPERETP
jgi:two-component system OmpR family response regulator